MHLFVVVVAALVAQPTLDLPPDEVGVAGEETPAAAEAPLVQLPGGIGLGAQVDEDDLMKGLQDARLHGVSNTVIGGYAQLNANLLSVGPGDDGTGFGAPSATADVRRLVVFVAHTFSPWARFYTELEWEHALACRTCSGASEIEQAFVEIDVVKVGVSSEETTAMTARAGLILIPMGIINQWHEPPIFHGVDRPRSEELVIPSTWRELGAGVVGSPLPGFNYELYLTTGLDPLGFDASGIGGGRKNGSFVDASSWMVSGRAEVEPFLGFLAGVSGVAGDTGGSVFGATRFIDGNGDPRPLTLPLYGIAGDARVRRGGLEARTVVVGFFFPYAADLMTASLADGTPAFLPPSSGKGAIATRTTAAQLEVAYDVLRLLPVETEQQLLPFVRVDFTDTQNEVPDGFVKDESQTVKELTVGVSYRPFQQVVIKADGQLRNRALGLDEGQLNLGLGLMF